MTQEKLKQLLEAVLMAAEHPMSLVDIMRLLEAEEDAPAKIDVDATLQILQKDCEDRGYELLQVATGYRFQVKQQFAETVSRMWDERPKKYSRALLETLALIAYRQPITRAEIEDIRGVSVSSYIVKTLMDREWVQIVGHREAPGRPALYATTREFLDYFSLQSLDQLPNLKEIKDLDSLHPLLVGQEIEEVEEGVTSH